MIHPLKVAGTLADETRFSIYEAILQTRKVYTVQQIAEQFHIHPNVARLHLTKLVEIGVIGAEYEKTGKGGRPGRVYQVTNEIVSLSFPKREESNLLKWTLELINRIGEEAVAIGKEISYQDGYNKMKPLSSDLKYQTFDKKLAILSESASLIGYIPKVQSQGEQKSFQFTIYNCPYREQLNTHHQIVCTLHEANLRGQMDALFGDNDFVQFENMAASCEFCQYEIKTSL